MRIYFFVDQEPSSFILATMVPSYGNIWGFGYSFNLCPNRSVDLYYFSLNGLLNDYGIFYKQGCRQKDADEAVDDAAKAIRMLAMLATFRTRGH